MIGKTCLLTALLPFFAFFSGYSHHDKTKPIAAVFRRIDKTKPLAGRMKDEG